MGHPVYRYFRWSGRATTLNNTSAREDHQIAIPPISVRRWADKPALQVGSGQALDEALQWLWSEMASVSAYMRRHYPNLAAPTAADFAALSVRLGSMDSACDWTFHYPDGTALALAVVAVYERGGDAAPGALGVIQDTNTIPTNR